jgi:hypothetical protein
MPCIILPSITDEGFMMFLMELKELVDQRGYLPEIDELWSDAMAEGEICDGALLNALMRVAIEEGREDDLQVLFE